MIHSNMRKLIKRFMCAGDNTGTSTLPLVYDFTDITGYTGTATSADAGALYLNGNSFATNNFTNLSLSGIYSWNAGASAATAAGQGYYIVVGNTSANELDYTLGTILSENLVFSTANTKQYDALAITTISNTGNTDITFDEIGLFLHAKFMTSSSGVAKWTSGNFAEFLLIKEQLETAKTIPAYSSISITFNLFGEVTIE